MNLFSICKTFETTKVTICTNSGNFYATGQIFISVSGQRLKKNLAIWSHCCQLRANGRCPNALSLLRRSSFIVKMLVVHHLLRLLLLLAPLFNVTASALTTRRRRRRLCRSLFGDVDVLHFDAQCVVVVVVQRVPKTHEKD